MALKKGKSIREMRKELEYLGIKIGDVSIESLDFSVRTYNCLKRSGVKTLSDMKYLTERDYQRIRNLGRRSLDEIIDKLGEYGITIQKR